MFLVITCAREAAWIRKLVEHADHLAIGECYKKEKTFNDYCDSRAHRARQIQFRMEHCIFVWISFAAKEQQHGSTDVAMEQPARCCCSSEWIPNKIMHFYQFDSSFPISNLHAEAKSTNTYWPHSRSWYFCFQFLIWTRPPEAAYRVSIRTCVMQSRWLAVVHVSTLENGKKNKTNKNTQPPERQTTAATTTI